jgi:cytochrome b subunit of formate dehydrogenase/uncharacterized protein with PIN domain
MKKISSSHIIFSLILYLIWQSSFAQDNSDCLMCHGDKTLTKKVGKQLVSVYVDEQKLSISVHGKNACVGCHTDLAGKELPHGTPVAKANCGSCHPEEQKLHADSLHGQAISRGDPFAPFCQTCHGNHDILPVKNRDSAVAPFRVPFVCGKCHQEGSPVQRQRVIHQDHILENYSESIHGEGLLKRGLAVSATCASCHTPHHILPHTDSRSSIARKNIAATCAQCHTQIEQVHRKVIRGELWEKEAHVLPACVDCHQPHKVRKVFYEQGFADSDCLRCHAQKDLRRTRDGKSLYVDATELMHSRHQKVSCSQCHSEVSVELTRPCAKITKPVECSSCHAEIGQMYQTSIHGKLFNQQDPNAPTCLECHGTHGILGKQNPKSNTFPTNVPALCARCHREGRKAATRYTGQEHQIIERYTESIHGKGLLKSGLTVTAMCTNCHTAHGELPQNNPDSSVNPKNIPTTCGRCHHGIEEQFVRSIHSAAVTKTTKELPVCSDCHTAHTIRRTDQEGFKLDIMTRCGRCHESIAATYFDTYHGKISRLGYGKTAKCYDCHGAHDVLAVADPGSHLSRKNVVATCQKCHPGANRRFAGYLTHSTHHDPKKYPILFWTFWGMTSLLIGTFAFFGVHTLLWLPRAVQMRRELNSQLIPEHSTGKQYRRFSRLNRTLHIVMIVSFMNLALTGLTLKFSYTSWAVFLSHLFGGFESAGYVHRVAAVIMVIIFGIHIFVLLRELWQHRHEWRTFLFGANTIIPILKDITDFIGTIKWFLGLGSRPLYGRWTYWEKFDYFAVFWGVPVVGITGLMLWFPELFTRFLPGWLINVATIIHSDEALLAIGFIFTIHFFNTHLRPEKFPMDTVIFTGMMPLDELQRDKPLEYDELTKTGQMEQNLAEPYPPIVMKSIRLFGWTALTIGFSIVVWIIYAMIFAYR